MPTDKIAPTQGASEEATLERLRGQIEGETLWLAKCDMEIAEFAKVPEWKDFEENWHANREASKMRLGHYLGLQAIVDDRDEWRTQHENLLSVRASDLEAHEAARLTAIAEEREAVVAWLRSSFGDLAVHSPQWFAAAIEAGEHRARSTPQGGE